MNGPLRQEKNHTLFKLSNHWQVHKFLMKPKLKSIDHRLKEGKRKGKKIKDWSHKSRKIHRQTAIKEHRIGRGGGGRVRVRFRSSLHLRILLFIAREPQKLDRQKYISLASSFHKLFTVLTFRHLISVGKTLSWPEVTMMHVALITQ